MVNIDHPPKTAVANPSRPHIQSSVPAAFVRRHELAAGGRVSHVLHASLLRSAAALVHVRACVDNLVVHFGAVARARFGPKSHKDVRATRLSASYLVLPATRARVVLGVQLGPTGQGVGRRGEFRVFLAIFDRVPRPPHAGIVLRLMRSGHLKIDYREGGDGAAGATERQGLGNGAGRLTRARCCGLAATRAA